MSYEYENAHKDIERLADCVSGEKQMRSSVRYDGGVREVSAHITNGSFSFKPLRVAVREHFSAAHRSTERSDTFDWASKRARRDFEMLT